MGVLVLNFLETKRMMTWNFRMDQTEWKLCIRRNKEDTRKGFRCQLQELILKFGGRSYRDIH